MLVLKSAYSAFTKIIIAFLINLNLAYAASIELITIDAGCTYTRMALFQDGQLHNIQKFLTPHYLTPELKGKSISELQQVWLNTLSTHINKYRELYPNVEAVALAFPGPVTPKGDLIISVNLWGNEKQIISNERLKQTFGLPVYVNDDVSSELYYYTNIAQYKDLNRISLLTISTGISIKLYDRYSQRILKDKKGRGGSIGQIKLTKDKTLQNLSSGRDLINLAKELATSSSYSDLYSNSLLRASIHEIEGIDSELFNQKLLSCYKQKDPFSVTVITNSIKYLAQVLETYIISAAPEKIIVRGGVAENFGEDYIEKLTCELNSRGVFGYEKEEIDRMFYLTKDSEEDGLKGAALMAIEIMEKSENK